MAEGVFTSQDTFIHALFMYWPFAVDKLSGPMKALIVLSLIFVFYCFAAPELNSILKITDRYSITVYQINKLKR